MIDVGNSVCIWIQALGDHYHYPDVVARERERPVGPNRLNTARLLRIEPEDQVGIQEEPDKIFGSTHVGASSRTTATSIVS